MNQGDWHTKSAGCERNEDLRFVVEGLYQARAGRFFYRVSHCLVDHA